MPPPVLEGSCIRNDSHPPHDWTYRATEGTRQCPGVQEERRPHPTTKRVHTNPTLVHGIKYLFWYISGTQKHPRTMVAKFIDRESSRYEDDHLVLSGRPEFGTTPLPTEWILGVDNLEDQSIKCYANVVVKSE